MCTPYHAFVFAFVFHLLFFLLPDSKLTSFQRQLNLYGFRRIQKGPDSGSYYHPNFKREDFESVRQIKRVAGRGATKTVVRRFFSFSLLLLFFPLLF